MNRMICFDMDGTIADLYGVKDWLPKLRAEDASPYIDAEPLCDMAALREILLKLMEQGWEVRIITWLAMDSSESYKADVTAAKRAWLKMHNFPMDGAHFVAYGTTKADCIRRKNPDYAILIDDNKKIRNGWHLGKTIDPTTCNIVDELRALIE